MDLAQPQARRCLRTGRLMGLAAGCFWTVFLLTRLGNDFGGDVAAWRTTLVLMPTLAAGAWLGAPVGEALARVLLRRRVAVWPTLPLGLLAGAAAGATVLTGVWLLFFFLARQLEVLDFGTMALGTLLRNAVLMGIVVGGSVGSLLGLLFGGFVVLTMRR